MALGGSGAAKKKNLNKELSLTAHRLDTGANWRVLVLSPAHHRSRLSDSVKNGNALSSDREIFIKQQEITTLTVIWARQLISP